MRSIIAVTASLLAAACTSASHTGSSPRGASATNAHAAPAGPAARAPALPNVAQNPAGIPSSAPGGELTPRHAGDAVPSGRDERTLRFGDSATERELEPIFAGTTYDAQIPPPDSALRQPLGTFTAHHAEIVAYLRKLEAASPRIRVTTMGRTHEGRELCYAVIASPENMAKIDGIRERIAKLADPRTTNDGEADAIVADTPAIAWLGYSIHGDEMSGSDASMAVAYHLVAGTSADVTELLANVVVVLDPCQNPDGRERILSQLEQGAGYVPNLDVDSMSRGRWPHGRGNHYLFDMNRDWIWGTQPETRARWGAIGTWHPQLLVDAHEMGASDTFLFYPATDPFTPHFPAHTRKWWQRFADDQARAFDAHGWSYYTREWADSWYPGYTDSWGSFVGAVGILYEQARFVGQSVRRPSGEIATYRGAVARQATGSIANVTTLARNRVEMLRDYYATKKENVSANAPGNDRMFALVRGRHPEREAALVQMFAAQRVEIFTADREFRATNVDTTLEGRVAERTFPAGTWLIPARQPLAPLVKAFLAFDPRYDKASLAKERKELERKQQSKAYDVTGWSPAHLWDVDGYWCDAVDVPKHAGFDVTSGPVTIFALPDASAPVYAWTVDGASDRAVVFAARALELGLAVEASDEPFRARDRSFARGSLLVRRVENGPDVAARVQRALEASSAQAYALGTARSPGDEPDLGGRHFRLLARPRVGLLSNNPVSTGDFGATWHLVDAVLGVPVTLVDAQELGSYDLRRYNVLVLPEGGIGDVVRENADALATWVRGGGTLIASGSAAAAVCRPGTKLTNTRLREDALDKLDEYALAVQRERAAGQSVPDEGLVWDGKPTPPADAPADDAQKENAQNAKSDEAKKDDAKKESKEAALAAKEDKARRDAYLSTFSPQGVILRGEVNPDSWLTYGCASELPVYFAGSDVFLSQLPVRTAVRLARSERLRLSGLLWPEARERIENSGYAMIERKGAGQIILFASPPDFRNWCRGTMRLLANAIVYGPGLGARQPAPW